MNGEFGQRFDLTEGGAGKENIVSYIFDLNTSCA